MLDKNNLGTPIKKASLRERLKEAYNSQVGVEEYRCQETISICHCRQEP